MNDNLQTATLAGGCFWCFEAIFQQLRGVTTVTSGYAGGNPGRTSYQQVSTGTSGHAEAVQIQFDPEIISYADLLEIFWHLHDPTTLNRQGNDQGEQYRSVIFYHDEEQKATAQKFKDDLAKSGEYQQPIVTQILPYTNFFKAEDYHQNYYNNNPNAGYCKVIISPKLQKLRAKYAKLVK